MLCVVIVALTLVLWREQTVIRGEAEDRARWSRYEHGRSRANDIVAIFLRAIVEDDYAAVRPLLRQVASERPRAAKAFGPEIQLRDKIHAWMAERGFDVQRLKSYGYGNNASMNADIDRYVVTGALFFDDGKFVGFRLTLLLTADRDGDRSYTSGWRVDDFVPWDIKRDGSVPFSLPF
jgi:hypothetical protein